MAQINNKVNTGIVINKSGREINFDAAVALMDDEIREAVHAAFAPCSEQEFFTAYEDAYAELTGEEWFLSTENPTY